jgi:uncharacterized protein DUF4398
MQARFLLPIVSSLALGACALSFAPDSEIRAAKAVVADAEPLAMQYAPYELQAAKDKLARAEAAMTRSDYVLAGWLAEEAQADAKLARSLAESERKRREVAEVDKGIQDLRQQLERRPQ